MNEPREYSAEWSQIEKDKYGMNSLICEVWKKKAKWSNKTETESLIERVQTNGLSAGEGGGRVSQGEGKWRGKKFQSQSKKSWEWKVKSGENSQ